MSSDCGTFDFSWEEAVESEKKTLKLRVGASLHSDLIPVAVSELSVCPERNLITENSEHLMIRHPVKTVHAVRSSGTMILLPVLCRSVCNSSVKDMMRKFYNSLSEKDRRLYSGIEAMKSGRGGIVYIADVLRCSRKTVSKGIRELKELPPNIGHQKRIRKFGGGRWCYRRTWPDIDNIFSDVLKNYTAGDPMKEGSLWTDLSYERIAEEMAEKHGIKVSTKVIRQLIKKHKFGKRKLQKKTTM